MSSKSRILYVRNISNRATHEDIRRHFVKYGAIYDLTVPLEYYTGRMKGYAFVEYNHSSDAREAHRKLDRTDFMGRIIEIEFARGQRRTPAEMMRLEKADRAEREARSKRDRRRSRSRSRTRSRSPPPASSSSRRRRSPSPFAGGGGPASPLAAAGGGGGGGDSSSHRHSRRHRRRSRDSRSRSRSRSP